MAIFLGPVQTRAAREDHVRAAQQLALALEQLRRGDAEGRQLVHAVEDDGTRPHRVEQRQRHRRVEPGDRGSNVLLALEDAQQFAQDGHLVVLEAGSRDRAVWPANGKSCPRSAAAPNRRRCQAGVAAPQ